jgi:isocitrate dehydrogenase kinase/phosphatase
VRPAELATAVLEAYEGYLQQFHEVTRRAPERFETRDWTGSVEDSLTRLRLYKRHIDAIVGKCRQVFGADAQDATFWEEARAACRETVATSYDADLALMFVDSVRRALSPETVVPYASDAVVDRRIDPAVQERLVQRLTRPAGVTLAALVAAILRECAFQAPFRDLAGDAAASAGVIEEALAAIPGAEVRRIEVLRPLFYRNKGAYIAGRIDTGGRVVPLAFALAHTEDGIAVDAVLTEESDLRRIFSYTRSNFHVELAGQYRELLDFLHSIMPHKNWAALYSSIGFMNPAKIQLSKDLDAHRLDHPGNKLTAAWGIPGLVMVVFTSPAFPYVFKVIRDDDKVTKTNYIGHRRVAERYRLVQEGDRVGRLLDTITFHHLRFRCSDFEPKILQELLEAASDSVRVDGDRIVIARCYAQREATPLPIYLRQADWPEIQRVLGDLGVCLKQIADAGLFPGEFDLKNFGVAEDGRVVFFDFDGLDELRRFSFDTVPLAASLGQEECFEYLLNTYRVSLVDTFRRLHPDLFTSAYWRGIQRVLERGEVPDTFPYPAHRRLENRRAATARPRFALPAAVERELERLGLRSAHRKGLLRWEPLGEGLTRGSGTLDGLTPAQRLAVRETFEVEEGALGERPIDVVMVDERPAFVYLPGLSRRVVDLSGRYTIGAPAAAEWRDRVRRALFRGQDVDFVAAPA